ncbi:MAG: ferritin-like domain-containing protein [Myxococcales bacterium]|nr:ferritin-like domain-containing protein [Myxococcales bacterium]
MRLTLDPLRTSLLAALGLLACTPGPKGGEDASDTQADTTIDPDTGSTAVTSGPSSASETAADTGETGMSAGGTVGTTSDETGATVTSATTLTEPTTSPATGESGESGDTGTFACAGAVEEVPQGNTEPPLPSGFEKCDGGIIHRAEKVECSVPATPNSCMDSSGGGTCTEDADCTDKPFGTCQQDMIFGGVIGAGGTCSCVYGCQSDDDCEAGQICRCGGDELGLYTQCISAGCTVDSDCPAGEICGLSPDICAPGGFETACTTPNDVCESNAECPSQPGCIFELDHWKCSEAVCGRPFVVESTAITAPTAAREDWRGLVRAPRAVDAATAALLADHWAKIGQFEHASVASFAQFVLQLLAVGAGPELVLAAQQALADEVEHARLAFALASLYAGTGVGPGPLAVVGAGPATELPAVVEAVIREACVGETLAAFEAREAAAQAGDPAVQAMLRAIAGDERRHAELGWRFVQWALAQDESLAPLARATFAAAIAEARAGAARDATLPGAPGLREHGVIDEPLRAEIWARGLDEVIAPCVTALLATRMAA